MERIALDATATITGSTGIARYVHELSTALSQLADAPTIVPFALGRAAVPPVDGTRHVPVPLRAIDLVWRAARHPRVERLTGPVTSLHAAGPVLPPAGSPVVAVVHDLAPLDHPELHPRRDVEQLRRYVQALDRADAVIAVSRATADRLVAEGVDPAVVHVVPNGRTPLPEPGPSPLPGRRYVLAVGAPVPRKAYDVLLRAAALLAERDLTVAVVGPPGPSDDGLRALARELDLGHRYHRCGPVTDAELSSWYHHAAALAAPSVDEGFGLTLVEALAAGTPVVATDLPVFREVTGGHGTFVPVNDVDGLAAAIDGTIRDAGSTPARERGRDHVARYRWDACAAGTLAVHREVARR